MNNTFIDDPSFTFIKNLTWKEVYTLWRNGEVHLPHWIEFLKQGGFSSWKEFRKSHLKRLKGEKRIWKLYRINNPITAVSTFYGGPYKSWFRFYGGKKLVMFKELVKNKEIQRHAGIADLVTHFPKKTTLICLETEKRIIVMEGMHRSCALALADNRKKLGSNIPLNPIVFVAIGNATEKEVKHFFERLN